MKEKHYILKCKTLEELQDSLDGIEGEIVFKKFFLTSQVQAKSLPEEDGAVSAVVQPPLDGSAAAVWIWTVEDVESVLRKPGTTVVVDKGGCEHIWSAGLTSPAAGSEAQTVEILETYEKELCGIGMNLPDNCIRTWFYVHDIDNNYAGMVKGRRENFEKIGLTPQTHYISSTGICGSPANGALVQMDAYAVKGDFTQRYLCAPTHLNPTYEYGVTFERGTRLDCGDNRRVFISGTASINNRGEVVHVGDVVAQTERMIENVDVLLREGGASFADVKEISVYLRNAGDYRKIAGIFEELCPDIPYVIVLAPVCRPDWLIEMECIAAIR